MCLLLHSFNNQLFLRCDFKCVVIAIDKYQPSGTSKKPSFENDIVILGQDDRGILEFNYLYPGKYMFHSHIMNFQI